MRVPKRPTVSGALGLLALAVALTGILVYATSLTILARSAEARVVEDAERLTEAVARTVDSVLTRPLASLQTLGAAQELHGNGRAGFGVLVEATLAGESLFRSIVVLDAAGVVRLSLPEEGFFVGADLSESAAIREARESGRFAWSRVYASLADGGRELSLVVPTKLGYVVGNLDFEILADTITRSIEVEKADVIVVDAGGTFVVHPDRAKVLSREGDPDFIGERVKAPLAERHLYRKRVGGASKLVIAERIPKTGWFILVEREANFSAEALRSSLLAVSGVAVLLVLLASSLAALTARRLILDVRRAVDYASFAISADEAAESPAPPPQLRYRETFAVLEAALEAVTRIRTRDEANRRLREALDELKLTQGALVESEKLALLGTLAANLAHELNTPLGAASAAASVLGRIEEAALRRRLEAETRAEAEGLGLVPIAEAALFYDPISTASPGRRTEIRSIAESLARAESLLAGMAGAGPESGHCPETGFERSSELRDLADRLHDLGLRGCDEGLARALLVAERAGRLGPFMDSAQALVQTRMLRIALERASMVVGAIRSYARIDPGETVRPVELAESLRAALALLYATMKRGVAVRVEAEEGVFVLGREDRLAQVWTNIVVNALDAMDYRGELVIRSGRAGPDRAWVEIEDSGPGIPPELRAEIWRPFFTTKPRGRGTGLGLSIVKKLIDESGGSVDYSSEPGRTVFRVELPLVGGTPEASDA